MKTPQFYMMFENMLLEALHALGISVIQGYAIPGEGLRLDLFIPGIPPAIIEIKGVKVPSDGILGQIARLSNEARAAFSGETKIFLVAGFDMSETNKNKLWNIPGIHLLKYEATKGARKEASRIALEIRSILKNAKRQYLNVLHEKGYLESGEILASEAKPPCDYDFDNVTNGILQTFRYINERMDHQALCKEISELLKEYNSTHYTACTLRTGRCLECIIYKLATRWGIEVNRRDLGLLTKLDAVSRKLVSMLAEFNNLDAEEKEGKKEELIEEVNKFGCEATKTINMMAVDKTPTARREGVPKTLYAILSEIKRMHQDDTNIKKAIEEILKIYNGTNELRKNSAHASPKGETRETSRDDAQRMYSDVQAILHKLVKIHRAIIEREKT